MAEVKPPERIRRLPSIPTTIKNLKPELRRVCIAGTVVSKNEELYSFLLDDGEGTILVLMNDMEQFAEVKEGQFIRAFGKIWGEGEEMEIQADLIQDFSKIDRVLYKNTVRNV